VWYMWLQCSEGGDRKGPLKANQVARKEIRKVSFFLSISFVHFDWRFFSCAPVLKILPSPQYTKKSATLLRGQKVAAKCAAGNGGGWVLVARCRASGTFPYRSKPGLLDLTSATPASAPPSRPASAPPPPPPHPPRPHRPYGAITKASGPAHPTKGAIYALIGPGVCCLLGAPPVVLFLLGFVWAVCALGSLRRAKAARRPAAPEPRAPREDGGKPRPGKFRPVLYLADWLPPGHLRRTGEGVFRVRGQPTYFKTTTCKSALAYYKLCSFQNLFF
jgi:hypothetical protein